MSYIWENYSVTKNFELAKKNFVPYTEVFNASGDNVKVNILYRFASVFNSMSDVIVNDILKNGVKEDKYSNILFHLLANIDFYSGITEKDCELMLIDSEIKHEIYGVDVQLYNKLIFRHKYKLLSYMFIKKIEKNRKCLFFDCLNELFDMTVYYSKFEDTYIIQIWSEQNIEFGEKSKYSALQLFEIVKEMLCDYWLKIEVYWNNPIGIIGYYIEVENTIII